MVTTTPILPYTRVIIVADKRGFREGCVMRYRKNETPKQYYQRLSEKEKYFEKKYPGCRVSSGIGESVETFLWIFPELAVL